MDKLERRQRDEKGAMTLMVLVLMVLFVAVLASSLRFISRQSHQTVEQEQEEQAFNLADSGVEYVKWLLSANGGNKTPEQLVASPPDAATGHEIRDANGQIIGVFSIQFFPPAGGKFAIRSIGWDLLRPELCQIVDAELTLFNSTEYKVTDWNHELGNDCSSITIGGCVPYSVTADQFLNGNIESSDCFTLYHPSGGNRKADLYLYEAAGSKRIQVDVISPTVNAYLTVVDPQGSEVIAGLSTRALAQRIEQSTWGELLGVFTAWAGVNSCTHLGNGACVADDGEGAVYIDGVYQIEVTTAAEGELGDYTLNIYDPNIPECRDEIDNEGDGLTDSEDPGCWTDPDIPATYDGNLDNEAAGTGPCMDGDDNDGDGATDYPADPGCSGITDTSELGTVACDNGVDDDGDSMIDLDDHGCFGLTDDDEVNPNNDDLANAIVIGSVPFLDTRSVVSASVEVGAGEETSCGGIGNTVWYAYTPTSDAQVTIDTAGSDYWTAVAVYTGSGAYPLTNESCAYTSYADTPTRFSWLATAGTTYYIQAGGSFGSSGTLTIAVDEQNCLATPTTINWEETKTGVSLATTDCYSTERLGSVSDLYEFTGTAGQQAKIRMTQTTGAVGKAPFLYLKKSDGTVLYSNYYCGGSAYDACVPWNEGVGAGYTLPVNDTYTIEATTYLNSALFDYTLSLVERFGTAAPGNDTFAGATDAAPLPLSDSLSTIDTTLDAGEQQPIGGIDKTVWYKYQPTGNENVTFNTIGSNYDTVMVLYDDTGGSTVDTITMVDSNDDARGTLQSEITSDLTAGRNYYVQVGGYYGASGDLVIVGDLPPPPPSPTPSDTPTPSPTQTSPAPPLLRN